MKRLLLLIVGISLASSLNGCCWRNRCCRPACDPCGGGGGGYMGAPQQAIPYGAVPTGALTPTYGAAAPMTTTSSMPVAAATTTLPSGNTSYYPPAQMASPTVAGLPVNPLPTF